MERQLDTRQRGYRMKKGNKQKTIIEQAISTPKILHRIIEVPAHMSEDLNSYKGDDERPIAMAVSSGRVHDSLYIVLEKVSYDR